MPRIIDVHTHLTTQIFIETVSRGKNWYGMTSENGFVSEVFADRSLVVAGVDVLFNDVVFLSV